MMNIHIRKRFCILFCTSEIVFLSIQRQEEESFVCNCIHIVITLRLFGKTGVTSGAGTAYHSGVHEFILAIVLSVILRSTAF
jgi:hypothetical protein